MRNGIYLGLGQLYFNNVMLGIPESEVTVHFAQTLIGGKVGDMKADQCSIITDEEATISCVISHLSLTQMETAFGRAASSKATLSSVLHFWEEVQLNTQAQDVTLSNDALVTSSVVVTNLLGDTTYTKTTDYTLTEATGLIARVTGGSISSGTTVKVDYRFTDAAAQVLKVGGADIIEQQLDFAVKDKNGKILQFTFPKAVRIDATDVVFSREGKANVPMTFKVHSDASLPKGERLFRIIEES